MERREVMEEADEYKKLTKAAREGRVDHLTSLIARGLDPNRIVKKGYHPPIYWACRYGHLQMVQLLIDRYESSPKYASDRGTTLLHVACTMGYLDIARYLANEHHLDPNARNREGATMLYSACYNGHLHIMKFLIGEMRCDAKTACVAAPDDSGSGANSDSDGEALLAEEESLLYTACSRGHLDIVMYLVHEQAFDPHAPNKFGVTPLHIACSNGQLEVVRHLVEKEHCIVACVDDNGCTPLHVACESSDPAALKIVEFLVAQDACDPRARDNCDNTPLHVACRYGRLEVVKVLLSTGKVDPSCTTKDGEAPIEIAKDKEIINELIRGGANTSNLKLEHLRVEENIESLVRVFVVGHPSSGKTTLVHALDPEQSIPKRRAITRRYREIHGVSPHTAGIIPYEFKSNQFGRVLMFDFAGQCEYYASHAALLECSNTSSAPLFMLVVNLSEEESIVQQRIRYWLSFIESHRISTSSPPDVIFVGSHKDVLKKQNPAGYRHQILATESFARNQVASTTLRMIGFYATNCRKPKKHGKLRQGLQQSCSRLRSNVKVDILCHYLGLLILDKFQGRMSCTIEEIVKEATASQCPVPLQADRLAELCTALSDRMNMLFLRHPVQLEKSWVVLEIKPLLSTINGRLFAPTDFKEHCIEASSTGVLSSAHLKQNFEKDLNPDMVMAFLSRLEFCHEVSDDETLRLIRDGTSSGSDTIEADGVKDKQTAVGGNELGRELRAQFSVGSSSSYASSSVQTQSLLVSPESPPEVAMNPYQPSPPFPPHGEGLSSPEYFLQHPDAYTIPGPIPQQPPPMYPVDSQRQVQYPAGAPVHPPVYRADTSGRPLQVYYASNPYARLPNGFPSNPPGFQTYPSPPSHPNHPPYWYAESYPPPLATNHPPRDVHLQTSAPFNPQAPPLPTHTAAIAKAFPREPEKYLFFPAFISSERPNTGIWMPDCTFEFYTGWCLSCTKENQFFTPRFLQILLLRLSFGFAVSKRSLGRNGQGWRNNFDRECTIWRNGLRWLDLDGIETIVEMIEESKHVVLTMRGQRGSELRCVRLRSAVIRKILEAKQEFCINVVTREYLIDPSQLSRAYPVVSSVSRLTLYDTSVIVRAITEMNNYVYCSRRVKMQALETLLYFEPYTDLGEDLLSQIYKGSQQKNEDVWSLFYEFSRANCHRVREVSQILGVVRSRNPSPMSSLDTLHPMPCGGFYPRGPTTIPPENRCMEVSNRTSFVSVDV